MAAVRHDKGSVQIVDSSTHLLKAPGGVVQPEPLDTKTLWLIKLLYFLSGLSSATWGRLAAIYYNDVVHMTATQIGLVEGIMVVVRLVCQPGWGTLADVTSQKWVAITTRAVGSAILLLLAFPSVADGYTAVLLISTGVAVFSSTAILDTFTLDFLGKAHKAKYGQFRLYLAISFGGGTALVGVITDAAGFRPNFIMFAGFAVLYLGFTAYTIPSKTRTEAEAKADTTTSLRDLCRVLMQPSVLFFLVEMVVLGACLGVIERLLFVFLQNDLGASTTLCGLTVLVTVLLELPLFHYGERIKAAMGHDRMLLVAMAAYAVRAYGYTLLTPGTVWFVLLCELLHGLTLALMWLAAVMYARNVSPLKYRTTVMAVLSTANASVGGGGGAVLGGWVMDRYGGKLLYRCAALASAGLLVLHLGVVLVFKAGGWQLHPTGTDDDSDTNPPATGDDSDTPVPDDNPPAVRGQATAALVGVLTAVEDDPVVGV